MTPHTASRAEDAGIAPTAPAGRSAVATGAADPASAADVFVAARGGLAERLAGPLPDSPGRAVLSVMAAAYVTLAGASVAVGLVVTEVADDHALGRWDADVVARLAAHRTGVLDGVTAVGSALASTPVVLAVAVLVCVWFAIRRHWREPVLIGVALTVEVSVFLTTTLLVPRDRPPVPRLDPSPPTSSFPSGHTAAAVALYAGLALIASPHCRTQLVRALVWLVAATMPLLVGASRLYRGMHHPTDVAAGALLGLAALAAALLAVRVGDLSERRKAAAATTAHAEVRA